MFFGVTLPGTGNNVLQPGKSGILTMEKDFLVLTVNRIICSQEKESSGWSYKISDKYLLRMNKIWLNTP